MKRLTFRRVDNSYQRVVNSCQPREEGRSTVAVQNSSNHSFVLSNVASNICTTIMVAGLLSVATPALAEPAEYAPQGENVNHSESFSRSNTVSSSSSVASQTETMDDASSLINPPQEALYDTRAHQHQQVRDELVQIMISEDYSKANEVQRWQRIPKDKKKNNADLTWLEKVLRWIFDNNSDTETESSLAILSFIFKLLLVAALIAFIIWVIRRAGYLSGWINQVKIRSKRQSHVENYTPQALPQSWEQLPEHAQIPKVVIELLDEGQLTKAASMMYRGSLRWLVRVDNVDIVPATTEKQCLQQIQRLKGLDIKTSLDRAANPYGYISKIIQLWIVVAYDNQKSEETTAGIQAQLRQLIESWTTELSSSASANSISKASAKVSPKALKGVN